MAKENDALLLTPLKVGAVEVTNRVVFTAHGTQWNPWTDAGASRYIEYQRRRAASGVGLIIAEGLWIDRDATPAALTAAAGPMARFNKALREVAPSVVTVLQLVGAGASGSSEYYPRGQPLTSFNGMQSSTDGEVSHRMSSDEIWAMVENHAKLAAMACANGMDGVELLGGYGYLIHQSLSPWGNGRTDRWGEPLEFLRAILDATRQAVGPDKIIGLRMPVDDDRNPFGGGNRQSELADLGCEIVSLGKVDYLNPCMGSRVYEYTARTARSYRHEPGVDLPLAATLRHRTSGAIPIVGVNRILTPEQGEQALQRGDCDLVALTRAHMVDPDLLTKFRAGQSHRIRRCVGANECGSVAFLGLPLMCFHNPELGREAEAVLLPAAERKRVVIVGAGPAGLKAAELAARRGHQVVVADAAGEAGGQLRHVRFTTARELYGAVEWLVAELDELDVEIRLNTHLDEDEMRRLAPATVVLATGAERQAAPTIEGAGPAQVISPIDVLNGSPLGEEILIYDGIGDMEAALVAEVLLSRGKSVTYATPFDRFAPRAGYLQQLDLLPIFERAGCSVLTQLKIERVRDNLVQLVDRQGRRTERHADTIVAASVPKPRLELIEAARAISVPYHVIGDALAPRHARAAINNGDQLGRSI